jgi:glycosyltransferase involved in cell wall biosynthesis
MRVLMLGWEFPPHLSGGLGTACFGLTEGLAQNGVGVTFVMPHASGDEDQSHVEIVGANRVPLPPAARAATAADPAGSTPAETPPERRHATARAAAARKQRDRVATMLELIAIESPLRPYLTPEGYAARVAELRSSSILADQAVAELRALLLGVPGETARRAAAPLVRAVEALGASDTPRYLEFTGKYGHDLMAEVARYALVVAEVARHKRFDVVHAHDWMTVPAGIAAARVANKPLVVHVHASEYDRSGENVNTQVRDLEQLGLDAADRVICVSHFTASILKRRYRVDPRKLRVVHNAVRHAEHPGHRGTGKTIPEPIVLFLGRVTFQKGPDYFLEAAARVVRIEPRVKFVMSGSGDMLPSMVERAARMGIARNVHFTGFLRGKDVERMYAMADIYVMPSVSEPFGISPLEAMALDVPVIVSRQSGVSEILRNALKVDFWDVDDLANKILALLRYDALATELVESGKEEIRRFRWDQQGKLVAQVYEELVR